MRGSFGFSDEAIRARYACSAVTSVEDVAAVAREPAGFRRRDVAFNSDRPSGHAGPLQLTADLFVGR
jgi:hypothetical protein